MQRLLSRFAQIEQHEVPAVLWAFGYFFCLLCSYYVLRPLRDEMGIQAGTGQLKWLFSATFLTMFAVVPLFGWLTAKLPRRRLLPVLYLFFVANLLVFFFALRAGVAAAALAKVFFVRVSVFNLFVVSVFWSFMADLFHTAQAKRLYGLIAAGGTAGAIAGPTLTAALVEKLGTTNMLMLSAAILLLATYCIQRLAAWSRAQRVPARAGPDPERAIGGGVWAGLRELARSPYLLGICAYLLCFTMLSTFLYFQQAELVRQSIADSAQRTALFAKLDLAVNLLTLTFQLFVFSQFLARLGIVIALVIMPLLSLAGFAALAVLPTLAVLIIFGVTRRAGEYALSKPARETLFNVLTREEKYKAKNVIDTLVYRGGDAISGWLFDGLRSLGFGFAKIAFAALPVAGVWALTGYLLGKAQLRRTDALSPAARSTQAQAAL